MNQRAYYLFIVFFIGINLSSFAQQQGYFGVWEEKFNSPHQVWQVFDTIDDLIAYQDILQGYIPLDIEYYQVNGEDKYFGLWEEANGRTFVWYFWTNIGGWLNINQNVMTLILLILETA